MSDHRLHPLLDLICTIPGLQLKTAETILAEVGYDMARFPSRRHLASWAGLSLGLHESTGKRKRGRIRRGNLWLRWALLETAWAASRTRGSYLYVRYHQWRDAES